MSFETDADRLGILQAVGEQITFDGAQIWAVFRNAYIETVEISGTRPTAECRTSDVASATSASVVVAGGVNYRVAVIQPDGTGMTLLVLERS